jgi:hypothetical protein
MHAISNNVRGALRLFSAIHRPPQVNTKRADRAALAIIRRDPDELPAVVIVDMLTDLQHHAERIGLDWSDLVARAQDHRNHEAPDDPADMPLAIIGQGDYSREVRP